jgi:hypothetical protein
MSRLALLGASSVVWLLAGCHVTAEVDRIERTFPPVMFPGAGEEHAGARMSYTRELKLDVGTSLPKLITELELRRAVVRPASGVASLDFVNNLTLTVSGDATLPALVIARFDDSMPLGAGGEIDTSVPPAELAPYLQKSLPLEVAADIDAPEEDWSVEVTVEFRAASDGKIML